MFYFHTGDAGESMTGYPDRGVHVLRSRISNTTNEDDNVRNTIVQYKNSWRGRLMHARSTPQSTIKHSERISIRFMPPPLALFGNPNREGECIPRYSRRRSCAEFSEVCILDHRLLSTRDAAAKSQDCCPLTRHSTSRRHAASRTPRPPCCAYPNWKGSSGPWKKALSSAFSPGYHLTSRFSKSAK